MKFLVFQHVAHEHPGLIEDWAKAKGVGLTVIELWNNFRLPNVEDFDALIVLGGPMGVYENYPAKDREIIFIKSMVEKNRPVLGFCLGSQLLAFALGARVYKNEKNGRIVKEIGYYDVELTDFGLEDPLFKNFHSPLKVLQWHGDTFDLPTGAILLATAPDCKNQAFKCQNSYGIQFHTEFTPEMVDKQIEQGRVWIHQDFQIEEEQLKQQAKAYAELMKKQCNLLMDNFISTFKA